MLKTFKTDRDKKKMKSVCDEPRVSCHFLFHHCSSQQIHNKVKFIKRRI